MLSRATKILALSMCLVLILVSFPGAPMVEAVGADEIVLESLKTVRVDLDRTFIDNEENIINITAVAGASDCGVYYAQKNGTTIEGYATVSSAGEGVFVDPATKFIRVKRTSLAGPTTFEMLYTKTDGQAAVYTVNVRFPVSLRSLRTKSISFDLNNKTITIIPSVDAKNIGIYYSQDGNMKALVDGSAPSYVTTNSSGFIYVNKPLDENELSVSFDLNLKCGASSEIYRVTVNFDKSNYQAVLSSLSRKARISVSAVLNGTLYVGASPSILSSPDYSYAGIYYAQYGTDYKYGYLTVAESSLNNENVTTEPGSKYIKVYLPDGADNRTVTFDANYTEGGSTTPYGVVVDFDSTLRAAIAALRIKRGTITDVDFSNQTITIRAESGVANVGIFNYQFGWRLVAAEELSQYLTVDSNKFLRVFDRGEGRGTANIKIYDNNKEYYYAVSVIFDTYTEPSEPAILTAIADIGGTAQFGQTLTAGALEPIGATAQYQWEKSSDNITYTEIPGATSNTYTLAADDCGNYFRVKATGTGEYTGTVSSAATTMVSTKAIDILNVGGVTAPVRGETPAATVTETAQYTGVITWSPNDVMFKPNTVYTATVVLTPKPGYAFEGIVADSLTVTGAVATNGADSGSVTAVFPATEKETLSTFGNISGTVQVGQTLTAGAVTPADATVQYRWQRSLTQDGGYVDITGATSVTYTTSSGDLKYYVRVIAEGTGDYSGTISSNPTAAITFGVGDLYQKLKTMHVGPLYPEGITVTYQWQWCATYDGAFENIPNAIFSSFKWTGNPGVSYEGRYLRVIVTGTGSYAGLESCSNIVGPVYMEKFVP